MYLSKVLKLGAVGLALLLIPRHSSKLSEHTKSPERSSNSSDNKLRTIKPEALEKEVSTDTKL